MDILIKIKNINLCHIQLKRGENIIDRESLTINRGFDTLLIRAIDKLLTRNKIDRLLLKSLKIQGEIEDGSVLSMTLKTVKIALSI